MLMLHRGDTIQIGRPLATNFFSLHYHAKVNCSLLGRGKNDILDIWDFHLKLFTMEH